MMRVPHIPPHGFMTRPQAAKYLGISQSRVKQLILQLGIEEKQDRGFRIYSIKDIEILSEWRKSKNV